MKTYTEVKRVSVNFAGQELPGGSGIASSMSVDGRYVAFTSENPVAGGNGRGRELYLRDMDTGRIQLITRGMDGSDANGIPGRSQISADGRYVAYSTTSSNASTEDTNSNSDVYVYDRVTRETKLISSGEAGVNAVFTGAMTTDGRYIAYVEHRAGEDRDHIKITIHKLGRPPSTLIGMMSRHTINANIPLKTYGQ